MINILIIQALLRIITDTAETNGTRFRYKYLYRVLDWERALYIVNL